MASATRGSDELKANMLSEGAVPVGAPKSAPILDAFAARNLPWQRGFVVTLRQRVSGLTAFSVEVSKLRAWGWVMRRWIR